MSMLDRSNLAPLHLATRKWHEGVVRLLLDRGANVSPLDKWRMTPLHLAGRHGHEGVVNKQW